MEKIEIKDMVTLRAYALSFVKNFVSFGGVKTDESLDAAKYFEAYIKGNAELPEYNSPMDSAKMWSDMLDKINKPCEPLSMFWIGADDEMKPAKDKRCVVVTKSGSYYFGMYDNGWYVNHKSVGDDIVAWMPIPEYKPSV